MKRLCRRAAQRDLIPGSTPGRADLTKTRVLPFFESLTAGTETRMRHDHHPACRNLVAAILAGAEISSRYALECFLDAEHLAALLLLKRGFAVELLQVLCDVDDLRR